MPCLIFIKNILNKGDSLMNTIERILDALDVITCEMDYIYEAIKNIDNSVPEKSQAIADVISSREATNRKCIDFYKRLLDSVDWDDFDTDEEYLTLESDE